MRSTQLITGALAVVATSALIGLGAPATAMSAPTASESTADESTTTREKGIVLECHGSYQGRAVYTSLYENDTFGNTLQILIGDDDDQVGGGLDTDQDFRVGRQVQASLEIDGAVAAVEGTARKVGSKIAVHEEHDDAGQLITVDGTHRRLATDLDLSWQGVTVPLDCDPAFIYKLRVTKEPAVA